jgi:hypothetical protein
MKRNVKEKEKKKKKGIEIEKEIEDLAREADQILVQDPLFIKKEEYLKIPKYAKDLMKKKDILPEAMTGITEDQDLLKLGIEERQAERTQQKMLVSIN